MRPLARQDVEELQDLLRRSSLGRIAFFGELYDVRNESLSSLSLLNASFPQDLVKRTNVHQMEFLYKFTENASDRFQLVNVEAELQLSFLLGLVKVEGSGKFLTQEKKSEKTISCSLMCRIQTQNEKIFASLEDLLRHVDMKLLENPKYTHVVTEIDWGANCLLNLEFAGGSECEKLDIQGRLAAELANLKVVSVEGGGRLQTSKSSLLSNGGFDIKVFADVVPEGGWPTTVEGFFSFVKDVPRLLNNVNEGKGKPLNYTMIPLCHLRQLAKLDLAVNAAVMRIDESFFVSTLHFFEEVRHVKQKLHDLCALLKQKKQYLKEDDLKKAERMKAQLVVKESELKSHISADWVSVRSGEKTLKDLMTEIENFKKHHLDLLTYEEYLNSFSSVVQKISAISDFISKGILYLGKEEKFEALLSSDPSSEFIVLVKSSETERADPELHGKTLCHFRTLAAEARCGVQFVVVDFDVTSRSNFPGAAVTTTKILRLKGSETLSQDVFAEYLQEKETAWVRLRGGLTMELCHHKPGNRVALVMTCPGQGCPDRSCSANKLSWKCFVCKNNVEYGFDNFYYCSCGRNPAESFEYRCTDPRHGSVYIPASEGVLERVLLKLRPLKEMNVLVIGQSGVGKSTWINSIVNYLSYDSFEDAKDSGVICTIPAEFTVHDPKTFEEHTIKIGQESDNEVTVTGNSATQNARTYSFPWNGRCVRIIDTPGLGDTRGMNQDKENLNNIIDHLGYLQDLHGVCILVKANENRITTIFSYCLKELLVHMHKSITKNIVFCFTNSRTSLYSPGRSAAVLKKVITDMGLQKDLGLGEHNMFSLDNEAFLFLCTLTRTNIEHSEVIKASFRESWKISQNETKRLFSTIGTFEPHLLKETLSLVTARSRVLSLTKPIAEITKTIQMNVSALERNEREIRNSDLTLQKLREKLNFTEIHLEVVPLKNPRTVCTSPSCVEHFTGKGSDFTEIEYKTHCHSVCWVSGVTPKTVNNALLRKCSSINECGNCDICGCFWTTHMHLTYEQKRVHKTAENKFIKEDLLKEESQKNQVEKVVENLQAELEKYKKEQTIIIQTSVKFGMFLRNNAISVYNDSVADYLEYLIDEEKKKPHKTSSDKKMLQKLTETLECYNAEVEVFRSLPENDGNSELITAEQVHELEQQLYQLELTGKQIRESVALSRSASASAHRYMEVPVSIGRVEAAVSQAATFKDSVSSSKNDKPTSIFAALKSFVPSKLRNFF